MSTAIGTKALPESHLSPRIRRWFVDRYGRPTAVQAAAWPVIAAGDNALVVGATGSGKSLAAWLPLIGRLAVSGHQRGVSLLYISPLRALSRDMANGLEACLEGLARVDCRDGQVLQIGLRTGDTRPTERARQRRCPPDILLTTPESLFVLLGSRGGRDMLRQVRGVIVDEIHALVENKRGAHLALSLERLQNLTGEPLQRIGLSATSRPRRLAAGFLAGAGRSCRIVGDQANTIPELKLELPDTPLGPFAGSNHWDQINNRLVVLATQPGNMLVFCNTRSQVERVAAQLEDHLPNDALAVHHGSVGRDRRETVEQGMKQGQIKVVVCSSSLELGIDIGVLDRVCQLGAPRGINPVRQRAGRARHRPDAVPRLHAFPLTLSDLLDWQALAQALGRGQVDVLQPCRAPHDVLCQHLVAIVAAGQEQISEIYRTVTRAFPWRKLPLEQLESLIAMLHDGFVPGREVGLGPITRLGPDRLVAATGAARMALLNAGTIPEWFEYEVIAPAQELRLGKLDEEFAFESSPGQILQLGGQHWRILRVLPGRVEVEDAGDETPNLPFWFGDGSGRSTSLSRQLGVLLGAANRGRLPADPQLAAYLAESRASLGRLPDDRRIVLERFFDPSGDQHLVIHSVFGARLNRAWGLALRKRFCRGFNFELQAAATDNGVLISLGAVHSFDLDEVPGWLKASQLRDLLIQAMLDTPIFQTRLRWCANTAMAIQRRDFQGRIPAQVQRNQTENLIARIFPDQLACLENLSGERRVPDHPLVEQALRDCLNEYLDLTGLERLYRRLERGEVHVQAVDTTFPSPLAMALIHAPRNSFLDPAAAEERRTRSFEQHPDRRAAPSARPPAGSSPALSSDRFEQQLLSAGYLLPVEAERQVLGAAFLKLVRDRSAISLHLNAGQCLWVHVERLAEAMAIWPDARLQPLLPAGLRPSPVSDADEALSRLLLGRCRLLGGVTVAQLAGENGLDMTSIHAALLRLRTEGLLTSQDQGDNVVFRERKPAAVAAG